MTPAENSPDASYPGVNISRIAFGSCHSRGAFNKRLSKSISGTNGRPAVSTIWDVIIESVHPQTFFWTGDAIYPPMKVKGDTPIDVMHEEYMQMLNNKTLGYANFLATLHLIGGAHGVWDDHDYGGNDRGNELQYREERRDEYLDFLGVPKSDSRRQRAGLYSSIEFGPDTSIVEDDAGQFNKTRSNKVKVIFLDTRWHREKHCIPSVGSNRYIAYGAILSCITRWFTAGFDLPSNFPFICSNQSRNAVLGEEQWMWLQSELTDSTASVHIIVSSIQVLTTNPVVESWGHFPEERLKLLRLLNKVPGLVILSGDVHHAEISTTSNKQTKQNGNHGAILEVTSSGLTHSCSGPKLYGQLCQPILNLFPEHRYKGGNINDIHAPSYYTELNFGSINLDWSLRSFEVQVHNEHGNVVLSTGSIGMDSAAEMTVQELESIANCIDGHFLSALKERNGTIWMALLLLLFCLRHYLPRPFRSSNKHSKKD